ncbi:MAG TPA: hypothetical protein DCS82_11200 [Rhodospirillaceae bacterium]|nr:hypothetical protein [Rhodospirillaceae bacterium]
MSDTGPEFDELMENGMRMAHAGDFAGAAGVFRDILAREPAHAGASEGLGLVALEQGEFEVAVGQLRRALEIGGVRPDLLYNLGNAEAASGRFAEAADAYRRATEMAPAFIEAWFNLAEVLEKLDRLDESIDAYRAVVALDASIDSAHANLGCVLTEAGHLEEAIKSLGKAIELAPEFPPTHTNLGNALKYAGRFDESIAAHKEALRLAPDYADARYNLGAALAMSGDHRAAAESLSAALALKPDLSRAKFGLGASKIALDQAEEAVNLCEAAPPNDCEMLALRPFALAAAGRVDDAAIVADYDRLIAATHVSAPDGYSTLADFNAALVDHILGHPSLAHAPTSHATVNGQHTGNLLTEPKGPFADFEKILWQAVQRFQAGQAKNVDHPFAADRPLRELVVWSIVMESEGHQVAHIHPSGWVSGVYYPQVPIFKIDGHGPEAGWIEFGAPPPEIPYSGEVPLKTVQPEEGLLLLFPSFFYHRTIPYDSEAPRVSIAFDFRPAS